MDLWQEFSDWAYARHANILSWYIRPLFVLPLAYFSWRRSWKGIVLTLVALLTSMFWFPAPETIDPRVEEFLAMEKELTLGLLNPTWAHVLGVLAVVASLVSLCLAFWRRSLVWGLAVINAMAILKIIWSVREGGDSGWAVVLPAVVGMLLCNLTVLVVSRRLRRSRSAREQSPTASPPDDPAQPSVTEIPSGETRSP